MVKLYCLLLGHMWQNENQYPFHGYDNTLYEDSYCGRCMRQA
jgi:hypothetical protein